LVLAFASSKRVSSLMKERPAPTAPAESSSIPVQPQVPAPEPKK
jgi:hypothetical protein